MLRRNPYYWKVDETGQQLPYLDEIQFLDLGEDQTAWLPALQSGQVHSAFNISFVLIAVRISNFSARAALPPWVLRRSMKAVNRWCRMWWFKPKAQR